MRRLGLVLALATLAVPPSQAAAVVRLESTLEAGLVMTDVSGCDDRVALARVQVGSTTEWEIARVRKCFEIGAFDLGPGCRPAGFIPRHLGADAARCSRFSGRVTANLFGGDDTFEVGFFDALSIDPSPLPITDPLTINLGAGNDTARGAEGNDSLNGGSGDDRLRGDAGNDTLSGSVGDDELRPDIGADTANGGDGNDTTFLSTAARDETDQVFGGPGTDTATYSDNPPGSAENKRLTPVRIIEANLETLAGEKDTDENDVLRSIERYGGGASSDVITGVLSSNNGLYHGGLSADQLFGTSGSNTLVGGAGADQLFGNGGTDVLNGKQGEPVAEADSPVDCGAGSSDTATLDLTDAAPTGCENVSRSAIREGPHVKPSFARVVAVRQGRVQVRLACPRKLRHRCAGTLELRLGKARSTRTRYAIRAGRSRRVAVELGALGSRIGRRTAGQLVSLERGDIKGLKTTLRRIVLRR